MSEHIIETEMFGDTAFVTIPPKEPKEEIVRCRDCKHYRDHMWIVITDCIDVCLFWHGEPTQVEADGFCAWGERK